MDRTTASQLRQRIFSLREERERLEEELLETRRLLRGSLLERWLEAGGRRRRTLAYYLSRHREEGGRQLLYVRKGNLERVRREVEVYRRYGLVLRRLRGLGREVLKAFKELRRNQEVPPP